MTKKFNIIRADEFLEGTPFISALSWSDGHKKSARKRLNYLIFILIMMEAEGGIEPPYTALQAVDLKLFFYLISRLYRKSGNPLLKPTLRRRTLFSHVSVLDSTTSPAVGLFTATQLQNQFQPLRCKCIRYIIK